MGGRVVRSLLDRGGAPVAATQVSTLELFFDLVFVFAVTQLTRTLLDAPGLVGVGRAVVLLGVLLWSYDSFAWVTNAAPPRGTAYRIALVAGMATFLVMALSIPHVFSGDTSGALGFGLGFLAATLVHGGVFLGVGSPAQRRAMLGILPRNLLIAGLVVAACRLGGAASVLLWILQIALVLHAGLRDSNPGFELQPEHFAERMGLLVIIVLGESVVAVGTGAAALRVDLGLTADVVSGLALCAALWWCYFDRDDEAAAQAFLAMPASRRPQMSMLAFGYPFMLVLGGVVLVAAGLHEAVGHPAATLRPAIALYLSAGVAAFLVGTVLVRVALRLGGWRPRVVAAVVAPAAAAVGTGVSGLAEVVTLTVLVVVLLTVETRRAPVAPEPMSRMTDASST